MTRRQCRHPRSKRQTINHADWDLLYDCNICRACGEWLSMGPSPGAPADEIRAARIIADVHADLANPDCWQVAIGIMDHDTDRDPPTGSLAWRWHAGWLARHIWQSEGK